MNLDDFRCEGAEEIKKIWSNSRDNNLFCLNQNNRLKEKRIRMKIKLKKAGITDLLFLYKLVKNPKIPTYSRERDFKKIIEDIRSDKKIILYEDKRVGCIREFKKELSIAILPEYWNKGIGTSSIGLVSKDRKGLIAKIKPNNIGSIKVFQHNGFNFVKHLWSDGLDLYEK